MLTAAALILSGILAHGSGTSALPTTPSCTQISQASKCYTINGNPDLYGVGIRTCIYCQWVSTIRAEIFIHEESSGLLDANTIVTLAVSCTMVKLTVQNNIEPIEIVILLMICFGFVLSAFRFYTAAGSASYVGAIFRRILATAIFSYSIWFWSSRVSIVQSFDAECSAFGFFFAKLPIRGGLRYVELVFSILFLPSQIIGGIYRFAEMREDQFWFDGGEAKRRSVPGWVAWVNASLGGVPRTIFDFRRITKHPRRRMIHDDNFFIDRTTAQWTYPLDNGQVLELKNNYCLDRRHSISEIQRGAPDLEEVHENTVVEALDEGSDDSSTRSKSYVRSYLHYLCLPVVTLVRVRFFWVA